MVGRKTSGRCRNCERRKVKCDLARPNCTQCLRSRLTCPGYDAHSRFYVVKPAELGGRNSLTSPRTAPLSPTDVLRDEYVYKLFNGGLASRFWLMNGHSNGNLSTLDFIPQRLGESSALDHAVKCVCLRPQVESNTTRQSYLKALRSLQIALDEPSEARTSGTLAAALLLYTHEIFLNPFQRSWMVHAEGVVRLLEVRGPGSINTDLDRSILCGQVGTIFLDAVQQRKRCFLAEPEWNALLRQLVSSGPGAGGHAVATPNIGVLSVYLPGLICQYEGMTTASPSLHITEILEEIFELRQQLQAWRTINDPEAEQQVDGRELMNASSASLKTALNMSAVVFLVLTGFMYADMLCNAMSTNANLGFDEVAIFEAKIVDMLKECAGLVSTAKMKWEAMMQSDAVAAWAAVTPNTLMLHRVLKVAGANNAKMYALRADMEDLYNCLCQDDKYEG